MRRTMLGMAVALTALAGQAQAQEAPAGTQEGGIVVSGRNTEVPRAEAKRYVEAVGNPVQGQLSRFLDPVCPYVMGLATPYNIAIANRIGEVATAAGIAVDTNPKCFPNVIVILASDSEDYVQKLRKKFPGIFSDLSALDKKSVKEPGPVRAWRISESVGADGRKPFAGAGVPFPVSYKNEMPSRISLAQQYATQEAVVIIDRKAARDKSVGQIADYAAMRALAGVLPPKNPDAGTILSLFEHGITPPRALTALDRGYLEGLYDSRGSLRGPAQSSVIAAHISQGSKPEEPKPER